MIETPTVLVLGAGASTPYGFPTGRELVLEICEKLKPGTPQFRQIEYHNFSNQDIQKFTEALMGSRLNSVDAFLERDLEQNGEFLELGKYAIAQIILDHEKNSMGISPKSFSWYDYFYNLLNSPYDYFQDNNVSVITFNYDRSIEHHLINALQSTYHSRNLAECKGKLMELPIIHFYGKLDNLDWQEYGGVKYGSNTNPDDLHKAKDKIKIIPESDIEMEEDKDVAKARELLGNAKRLYFVGFGYNKNNLDRLRIKQLALAQGGIGVIRKMIEGTGFRLSTQEGNTVKEYFNGIINLHPEDVNAYKFIRNVPLK